MLLVSGAGPGWPGRGALRVNGIGGPHEGDARAGAEVEGIAHRAEMGLIEGC
jgi:hypothetical protein